MVSISTGTDPTNLLWYIPIAALPRNAGTGALDLSRYDMRLPADKRAALPLTKLVNTFQASFAVVAAQGDMWTLQTSLKAPLGRVRTRCCAAPSCCHGSCLGNGMRVAGQHEFLQTAVPEHACISCRALPGA